MRKLEIYDYDPADFSFVVVASNYPLSSVLHSFSAMKYSCRFVHYD